MPRTKKILTPQSQWILLLVGGLCLIYVGFNWRSHSPISEPSGIVSAVITPNTDVLSIPGLNISAPIIYSQAVREANIQSELLSGVVHLSGTAKPGEVGNAYIVGHSSNYKGAKGAYNEVFKNLPSIKPGDAILISHDKDDLKFIVKETRVVESTELWVMSQATDGARVLTLQTSYPVGTAKQRFVVISELADGQ